MNSNRTRSINLVADVLAPSAVILFTVGLFFLFQPEQPGSLFWTNMVYSVFMELIIFAYIVWLPNRTTSIALKWMCGIYSTFYIAAGVLWMLLFSLLLHIWWPLKVYLAVIAVLTILWIFIGALSLKIDNDNTTSADEIRDNRRLADSIGNHADMLLKQFNLLLQVHPELSAAASSVTSLCRNLATVSPFVMADSLAQKSIHDICSTLEEMLDNNSTSIGDSYAINLKTFADKSIIKLNFLKQSTRK